MWSCGLELPTGLELTRERLREFKVYLANTWDGVVPICIQKKPSRHTVWSRGRLQGTLDIKR